MMPGSSPRPAVRHRERQLGGPTRYGSNTSEREYSALGDQLNALEQDIDVAREASSRARCTPGLTLHPEHEETTPSPHGEPVVLADGARILIRPMNRPTRDSSRSASSTSAPCRGTGASSPRSTI